MNQDNIYTQWSHRRRNVPVPRNFTQRVMAEIQHQQPATGFHLFDGLDPRPHRLARWAAAFGLIALGLFRIGFVAANLLIGGTL